MSQRLTIKIDLGNAAFEDYTEAPRILRELADEIQLNALCSRGARLELMVLRDINGNRVGTARVVNVRTSSNG